MLQQKNTAIAKQQRRHMAELLADHKLESARIRVENIIRSDITTELHEILELYCELLLARIQLLEQMPPPPTKKEGDTTEIDYDIDPGLEEAVRALVFAAPKTEIKELALSRVLLIEKFGKDFATECTAGTGVPDRVLKRLRVETPKPELVDAYLREIGRTYGVRFPGDPASEAETVVADEDAGEDDGEGGAKNPLLENPLQAEELERATPPRDNVGQPSPLRIAPPSPTTENVSPAVRLPGGDSKGVRPPGGARKTSVGSSVGKAKESHGDTGGPGGKIPDVDELAKRFAALKKM
jgi:vacuolar protein sorting-associated protein IST1